MQQNGYTAGVGIAIPAEIIAGVISAGTEVPSSAAAAIVPVGRGEILDILFVTAALFAALTSVIVATYVGSLGARNGFPVPDEARRIGCIDGLRGYLALGVAIYHFVIWTLLAEQGRPWMQPPNAFITSLGSGSVAIFFMITGLVFYPRIRAGLFNVDWKATYVGRVFRIYPLAIVMVVFLVLVVLWRVRFHAEGSPGDNLIAIATWLSFIGAPPIFGYERTIVVNGVTWSLFYEWIFYLAVLPLLSLAMAIRPRRVPTWMISLLFLVGSLAARHWIKIAGLQFLPCFAIGMLAYECRDRPWLVRILNRRVTAAVSALLLVLAMSLRSDPFGTPQLLAYALVLICAAAGNDYYGALRTPGALVLGEASYGIYLLHCLVLNIVFEDIIPLAGVHSSYWALALMPIALAAIAVVALSTFLSVELPGMRAGRTLSQRVFAHRKPHSR